MEKTVVSKQDPKGLDIKTVIGTFNAEQYKLIQEKFTTDEAVTCSPPILSQVTFTVIFEKGLLRASPLDAYAHRGSKVLCLNDYIVGDKAMCFVDIAQRIQGKNEYYPKEGDLVSLLNESVVFMQMPDHKRQFQNLWRVSKYITSDDRAVRPQIFVKSVVTNDEIQVNGWLGSPTIDVIIDYYKSLSAIGILHNDIKDSEKVYSWLNPFLRRQIFDRDFVFADEQSSFKEHTHFLNVGFSDDSDKSLKDIWNESGEIMRRTYAGIKPEQSMQFKLSPIEITKQEPQGDGTVKITFGADMHFEERKTGMSQEGIKKVTDRLKDILTKKEITDTRNLYAASLEPFTVSELGSLSSAIALMGYNLANGIPGTPDLKVRSAEALKLIHSKLIEKPKTDFTEGGMVTGAGRAESGSSSRLVNPEITVSGDDLKINIDATYLNMLRDSVKLNPLGVKSEKQHNKDRAFYLTDKIKICLGKDIKVNQAWIDELNELLTKFSEEYYGYDERNS